MHEMKLEHIDTGRCGDAYCPGHTETWMICTCGWRKQTYLHDSQRDLETRILKIEHLIGVEK